MFSTACRSSLLSSVGKTSEPAFSVCMCVCLPACSVTQILCLFLLFFFKLYLFLAVLGLAARGPSLVVVSEGFSCCSTQASR